MRSSDAQRGPLDDVGRSLVVSVQAIQRTTSADRDRLVGLLHQTRAALASSAAAVATPAGGRAPAGLAAWVHDLGSPVTAIVGWARMLEQTGDPAIRAHAVEAIDRNAKLLTDRLGNPPVWPAGVGGEQSEAA
jgi:signal transduction histidine kinase